MLNLGQTEIEYCVQGILLNRGTLCKVCVLLNRGTLCKLLAVRDLPFPKTGHREKTRGQECGSLCANAFEKAR